MKIYFNELESLGIYEKAFNNWCNEYDNLVFQKFEQHCNSFELFFDESGNVSWEEGEFIAEEGDESDKKYSLNELSSDAQEKAIKEWIYSYNDIVYEAFDNYAKAFKLYFDDEGTILGEDE